VAATIPTKSNLHDHASFTRFRVPLGKIIGSDVSLLGNVCCSQVYLNALLVMLAMQLDDLDAMEVH
jgi:hypothetical protein